MTRRLRASASDAKLREGILYLEEAVYTPTREHFLHLLQEADRCITEHTTRLGATPLLYEVAALFTLVRQRFPARA